MQLALMFVEKWENQTAKFEGAMKVKVLSELYLNIANAQLFLEHLKGATMAAKKAVEIAKRLIDSASNRLAELRRFAAGSQDEHQNVSIQMNNQKNIVVNASYVYAKGLEQLGEDNQKVGEAYTACKQYAYSYFGPNS